MKVLITTRAAYPFHGYGGMQSYFYYLSKHLVKQGIDVEILSSLDGSGKRNVVFEGVKYTLIPPNFQKKIFGPLSYHPYYHYFNLKALQYLRLKDFDILHGCAGVVDYLLFRHKKPVIFQPFGLEAFKEKNHVIRIYNFAMFYPVSRFAMLHADAIASEGPIQSKEIMSLFRVPKERIFILPDGVDLDEIDGFTKSGELTKENFKIQDADMTLINVNRLEPNKGIPYLIEALKILNENLDVRLMIVGRGSQEKIIGNQVNSLGLGDKVLFFGNIPDKKKFQLYTLADISVTPTLFEGLPIVVLEAMACRKPIVASDVSDIRSVVKGGENGFLVQPANPRDIAEKVLRIYDKNLFRTMGLRSKEIARSYDWSRIAHTAIEKYEELIGK